MEQYIPKSALVAEIKRMLSAFENSDAPVDRLRASTLISLLSFINTLEVKEVDLEKEIKNAQRKYKTIDEYEDYPCTMYANDIEWIAKHFFELGLKVAQKGE